MAIFTRTNGDAQQVFAIDTQNGPQTPGTALGGLPVQPQGPKLDFFTVTANANLELNGGVNGAVSNVLQAIQQLSTVALYQVDGNVLSVGLYPTGQYTTSTLATTVQAVGVQGNVTFASSNVQSAGFRLYRV